MVFYHILDLMMNSRIWRASSGVYHQTLGQYEVFHFPLSLIFFRWEVLGMLSVMPIDGIIFFSCVSPSEGITVKKVAMIFV